MTALEFLRGALSRRLSFVDAHDSRFSGIVSEGLGVRVEGVIVVAYDPHLLVNTLRGYVSAEDYQELEAAVSVWIVQNQGRA